MKNATEWAAAVIAGAFTVAAAVNLTVVAVKNPYSQRAASTTTEQAGPAQHIQSVIGLDVGQLRAVDYKAGVLTVHWQVGNTLTPKFVREGTRLDVVDILKGVHEKEAEVPALRSVEIIGTFPVREASGQVNPFARVIDLTYTRATLDRIDYATLSTQGVFDLSQPNRFIDPEMR